MGITSDYPNMKIDITLVDSSSEYCWRVYYGFQFTDLVKERAKTDINFKPLSFLLKILLSINNLNNLYHGKSINLNSFILNLIII